MRIYFHGAAGDVTGSAYHVVTDKASMLVDCGFFQGRKEESAKNRRKAQLEGGKLDAVVLTHGHLDHIGRLPLLTRNGYKGPIYTTRPTLDIATLILKDTVLMPISVDCSIGSARSHRRDRAQSLRTVRIVPGRHSAI